MPLAKFEKKDTSFKVIGNDKLNRKIDLTCNYISAQAKKAIEEAGGKVTLIDMNS